VNISVTDRTSIERGWKSDSLWALISISNPGLGPIQIPRFSPFRDVLHISFHDVEPVAGVVLPSHLQAMTQAQAEQIWTFVRGHRKHVQGFLANCQSGMSRSPAVAAALAAYFNEDEKQFWKRYTPNRHVYHLLIETMPEKNK
jgi:predicted protein tyrosine phosphatase